MDAASAPSWYAPLAMPWWTLVALIAAAVALGLASAQPLRAVSAHLFRLIARLALPAAAPPPFAPVWREEALGQAAPEDQAHRAAASVDPPGTPRRVMKQGAP